MIKIFEYLKKIIMDLAGEPKNDEKLSELGYDKYLAEIKNVSSSVNENEFKKLFLKSFDFVPQNERILNLYGNIKTSVNGEDVEGKGYSFAILDESDNAYVYHCIFNGEKGLVHNSIKITYDNAPSNHLTIPGYFAIDDEIDRVLVEKPFFPLDKEYFEKFNGCVDFYLEHHPEAKAAAKKDQKIKLSLRKQRQAEKRKIGYDKAYENCRAYYDFDEFNDDFLNDNVFWGDDLYSAFSGEEVVGRKILSDQLREWGFNDSNIYVRIIKFFISKRASKKEKILGENYFALNNVTLESAKINYEYSGVEHVRLLKIFEKKLHEDYKILMLPSSQFKNLLLDILGQ